MAEDAHSEVPPGAGVVDAVGKAAVDDDSVRKRRALYEYLQHNLWCSVDDLYSVCEFESELPEARRALETLQAACADFATLVQTLERQEHVSGSQKETPSRSEVNISPKWRRGDSAKDDWTSGSPLSDARARGMSQMEAADAAAFSGPEVARLSPSRGSDLGDQGRSSRRRALAWDVRVAPRRLAGRGGNATPPRSPQEPPSTADGLGLGGHAWTRTHSRAEVLALVASIRAEASDFASKRSAFEAEARERLLREQTDSEKRSKEPAGASPPCSPVDFVQEDDDTPSKSNASHETKDDDTSDVAAAAAAASSAIASSSSSSSAATFGMAAMVHVRPGGVKVCWADMDDDDDDGGMFTRLNLGGRTKVPTSVDDKPRRPEDPIAEPHAVSVADTATTTTKEHDEDGKESARAPRPALAGKPWSSLFPNASGSTAGLVRRPALPAFESAAPAESPPRTAVAGDDNPRSLHDKLSSPDRAKRMPPSQTFAQSVKRLAEADARRKAQDDARRVKLARDQARREAAAKRFQERLEERRSVIEAKLDGATARHDAFVDGVRQRAIAENAKVSEVGFIREVTQEGKRRDLENRMGATIARREQHIAEIRETANETLAAVARVSEKRQKEAAERTAKRGDMDRKLEEGRQRRELTQAARKPSARGLTKPEVAIPDDAPAAAMATPPRAVAGPKSSPLPSPEVIVVPAKPATRERRKRSKRVREAFDAISKALAESHAHPPPPPPKIEASCKAVVKSIGQSKAGVALDALEAQWLALRSRETWLLPKLDADLQSWSLLLSAMGHRVQSDAPVGDGKALVTVECLTALVGAACDSATSLDASVEAARLVASLAGRDALSRSVLLHSSESAPGMLGGMLLAWTSHLHDLATELPTSPTAAKLGALVAFNGLTIAHCFQHTESCPEALEQFFQAVVGSGAPTLCASVLKAAPGLRKLEHTAILATGPLALTAATLRSATAAPPSFLPDWTCMCQASESFFTALVLRLASPSARPRRTPEETPSASSALPSPSSPSDAAASEALDLVGALFLSLFACNSAQVSPRLRKALDGTGMEFERKHAAISLCKLASTAAHPEVVAKSPLASSFVDEALVWLGHWARTSPADVTVLRHTPSGARHGAASPLECLVQLPLRFFVEPVSRQALLGTLCAVLAVDEAARPVVFKHMAKSSIQEFLDEAPPPVPRRFALGIRVEADLLKSSL
jgi:hypothetical protein